MVESVELACVIMEKHLKKTTLEKWKFVFEDYPPRYESPTFKKLTKKILTI